MYVVYVYAYLFIYLSYFVSYAYLCHICAIFIWSNLTTNLCNILN